VNDPLDGLPVGLALEIDALCDDFERHWRRAGQRGLSPPEIESFAGRISAEARPIVLYYLQKLESELRGGVALPELPGLTIESEIGRGGMGVVYRARRPDGRVVAVKLIPGAEHARWSRWLAELADLRHPNLLPLESFGTHDGLHFVVMPLVTGGDLKERLSEFRDGRRAARLAAKVADAVGFLHQRGILHRDLKPSNILLSQESGVRGQESGEESGTGTGKKNSLALRAVIPPFHDEGKGVEPLVCDFGLAGRLGEAKTTDIVGTPAYMAPEQSEGRALTPAADVFGLGAVLHAMLTGRIGDEPIPDARLEMICRRCLHSDPDVRYPTAADLADELRRYLREHP
jgi:serine/threonine protein kinase